MSRGGAIGSALFVLGVVSGAILGLSWHRWASPSDAAGGPGAPVALTTGATGPAAALQAPDRRPVGVWMTSPGVTTRDLVTLRGTVVPFGSRVRVNGHDAAVSGRRWTKVVVMQHKGDNAFEIVASKPGHGKAMLEARIRRTPSAAEKASAAAARRARGAADQAVARRELVGHATTFPYNQLLAHPSRYAGRKAVFRGRILQALERGGSSIILLAVTRAPDGDVWNDTVWIDYRGTIKGTDGDPLTVYGTLTGVQAYKTQSGGSTSVPSMRGRYVVEPGRGAGRP
jgi:hypothetical protein